MVVGDVMRDNVVRPGSGSQSATVHAIHGLDSGARTVEVLSDYTSFIVKHTIVYLAYFVPFHYNKMKQGYNIIY